MTPRVSTLVKNRLTPEQKAQARDHWAAMIHAVTRAELLQARAALEKASHEVQCAILEVQIDYWRAGKVPTPEDPNPFT